jgi:predicted ATPase
MYIQKAEITNIKSIEKFEIEFKNPAGWHVLIGDNGSGKTTIVKAIALALIGSEQAQGLRANWNDWLDRNSVDDDGHIRLYIQLNKEFDCFKAKGIDETNENISINRNLLYNQITLSRKQTGLVIDGKRPTLDSFDSDIVSFVGIESSIPDNDDELPYWEMERHISGFFSCAFGPYRRFDSGNDEWKGIFENSNFAKLAAHLSVFGEDVAFTEVISWLKYLHHQYLEQKKGSRHTLDNIKKLINHRTHDEGFLPHNAQLEKVSSDGVFFKDGNGTTIVVNQMSDGYRSALSLIFELIRQLVRVYGAKLVFKNIEKGEMFIDLPGVVLIDEIDAHLHPTWQTRIGQWFLKYFPQLQFIVTTHSPLVCRACGETGSIWQLKAPGSGEESHEVTGDNRNRLVYGNISDAFGTGVFGDKISITADANDMLNRLSELNVKSMMGLTNEKENEELQELRIKFPNDVTR